MFSFAHCHLHIHLVNPRPDLYRLELDRIASSAAGNMHDTSGDGAKLARVGTGMRAQQLILGNFHALRQVDREAHWEG